MQKRVNISVDEVVFNRFKAFCKAQGLTVSGAINLYMDVSSSSHDQVFKALDSVFNKTVAVLKKQKGKVRKT